MRHDEWWELVAITYAIFECRQCPSWNLLSVHCQNIRERESSQWRQIPQTTIVNRSSIHHTDSLFIRVGISSSSSPLNTYQRLLPLPYTTSWSLWSSPSSQLHCCSQHSEVRVATCNKQSNNELLVILNTRIDLVAIHKSAIIIKRGAVIMKLNFDARWGGWLVCLIGRRSQIDSSL